MIQAPPIGFEHASVTWGTTPAVAEFTGSFTPGTVTALIGGDGAGKSVILRTLAGRIAVSSGRTIGLPLPAQKLGYQPSDSGVWRNLSVAENIEFVARAFGMDRDVARVRSQKLLSQAGLAAVRHRPAGKLSGGMRQKLGVVLALLHRPELVLLDEPTTGVDQESRKELWQLIDSAAADGAAVVVATTYLDEAERANRVFLLADGKVLAQGTPHEVLAKTPGTIWRAPVASEPARQRLLESNAWRRASTVYVWAPPGTAAPDGFTPAAADLENTCVALMLSQGGTSTAQLPPAHATPRVVAGVNPLISAEKVSRQFGNFTALNDVSLSVHPGEVVGLLGGNGAGKTTLMRVLLGLEQPSSGTVTLMGSPPSLSARRQIGYVAQGLGLYPSLSAIDNLAFAATVHHVSLSPSVADYARTFGSDPVGTLPLGAKRVLAYLAATVHEPELLILDEPTSGMDALTRAHLWREMRSLADSGVAILVTTHYGQEANQCDRQIRLAKGRVL